MQFFKLVGALAAGSGGQGRKRTADENVDLLAAKSEAFNKGLRRRHFVRKCLLPAFVISRND